MEITTKNEVALKILKVLSFIPLVIYPFIVLANLMSFLGHRSGHEPIFLIISCYSFLIFSSLYPLSLFYSLNYNKNKRIEIAMIPIFHLIISVFLGYLWMSAEQ